MPDDSSLSVPYPAVARKKVTAAIIRLTYALIDIWRRSYAKPPASVVLEIDDTLDVAHGHQEMTEWNAHYDERCFLPIHIYDTATGRPVALILTCAWIHRRHRQPGSKARGRLNAAKQSSLARRMVPK